MNFPALISVKPIRKFELELIYDDGSKGIIDLSHLAVQEIFKSWNEGDSFFNVSVDKETGAIAWSPMLDICPDAAYLQLQGLSFEQWQAKNSSYATGV